jgi:hypothetical protein
MTPRLEAALIGAIDGIVGYESDTFSWKSEGALYVQAEDVLAKLIEELLFAEDGYPGSLIDGPTIGNAVDAVIDANLPDGHD